MTNDKQLILVPLVLVDDEEIRPRTDPPVSDLATGHPRPQTSGFSSTLCRDSWFANFRIQLLDSQFSARSIDRDSLVQVRILCPVSRLDSGSVIRVSGIACIQDLNLKLEN